jgi:hypothetical protein
VPPAAAFNTTEINQQRPVVDGTIKTATEGGSGSGEAGHPCSSQNMTACFDLIAAEMNKTEQLLRLANISLNGNLARPQQPLVQPLAPSAPKAQPNVTDLSGLNGANVSSILAVRKTNATAAPAAVNASTIDALKAAAAANPNQQELLKQLLLKQKPPRRRRRRRRRRRSAAFPEPEEVKGAKKTRKKVVEVNVEEEKKETDASDDGSKEANKTKKKTEKKKETSEKKKKKEEKEGAKKTSNKQKKKEKKVQEEKKEEKEESKSSTASSTATESSSTASGDSTTSSLTTVSDKDSKSSSTTTVKNKDSRSSTTGESTTTSGSTTSPDEDETTTEEDEEEEDESTTEKDEDTKTTGEDEEDEEDETSVKEKDETTPTDEEEKTTEQDEEITTGSSSSAGTSSSGISSTSSAKSATTGTGGTKTSTSGSTDTSAAKSTSKTTSGSTTTSPRVKLLNPIDFFPTKPGEEEETKLSTSMSKLWQSKLGMSQQSRTIHNVQVSSQGPGVSVDMSAKTPFPVKKTATPKATPKMRGTTSAPTAKWKLKANITLVKEGSKGKKGKTISFFGQSESSGGKPEHFQQLWHAVAKGVNKKKLIQTKGVKNSQKVHMQISHGLHSSTTGSPQPPKKTPKASSSSVPPVAKLAKPTRRPSSLVTPFGRPSPSSAKPFLSSKDKQKVSLTSLMQQLAVDSTTTNRRALNARTTKKPFVFSTRKSPAIKLTPSSRIPIAAKRPTSPTKVSIVTSQPLEDMTTLSPDLETILVPVRDLDNIAKLADEILRRKRSVEEPKEADEAADSKVQNKLVLPFPELPESVRLSRGENHRQLKELLASGPQAVPRSVEQELEEALTRKEKTVSKAQKEEQMSMEKLRLILKTMRYLQSGMMARRRRVSQAFDAAARQTRMTREEKEKTSNFNQNNDNTPNYFHPQMKKANKRRRRRRQALNNMKLPTTQAELEQLLKQQQELFQQRQQIFQQQPPQQQQQQLQPQGIQTQRVQTQAAAPQVVADPVIKEEAVVLPPLGGLEPSVVNVSQPETPHLSMNSTPTMVGNASNVPSASNASLTTLLAASPIGGIGAAAVTNQTIVSPTLLNLPTATDNVTNVNETSAKTAESNVTNGAPNQVLALNNVSTSTNLTMLSQNVSNNIHSNNGNNSSGNMTKAGNSDGGLIDLLGSILGLGGANTTGKNASSAANATSTNATTASPLGTLAANIGANVSANPLLANLAGLTPSEKEAAELETAPKGLVLKVIVKGESKLKVGQLVDGNLNPLPLTESMNLTDDNMTNISMTSSNINLTGINNLSKIVNNKNLTNNASLNNGNSSIGNASTLPSLLDIVDLTLNATNGTNDTGGLHVSPADILANAINGNDSKANVTVPPKPSKPGTVTLPNRNATTVSSSLLPLVPKADKPDGDDHGIHLLGANQTTTTVPVLPLGLLTTSATTPVNILAVSPTTPKPLEVINLKPLTVNSSRTQLAKKSAAPPLVASPSLSSLLSGAGGGSVVRETPPVLHTGPDSSVKTSRVSSPNRGSDNNVIHLDSEPSLIQPTLVPLSGMAGGKNSAVRAERVEADGHGFAEGNVAPDNHDGHFGPGQEEEELQQRLDPRVNVDVDASDPALTQPQPQFDFLPALLRQPLVMG